MRKDSQFLEISSNELLSFNHTCCFTNHRKILIDKLSRPITRFVTELICFRGPPQPWYCWISLATSPVQPVWWLAPMPAPLSPWKYSWNGIRLRQCGSF